jgi:hypothetical protein
MLNFRSQRRYRLIHVAMRWGWLKWAFTPRLTDDGSSEVGQLVLGTAKFYRTLFGMLYYLLLELF